MAEVEDENKNEDLVQYQFKVDRDIWDEWKETVPRSKTLDTRLIELVEQDLKKKKREDD